MTFQRSALVKDCTDTTKVQLSQNMPVQPAAQQLNVDNLDPIKTHIHHLN